MLRWTTSTTIPLPKYPKNAVTFCYSTAIGTNIWMMFDNAVERTPDRWMFMMDTVTNKIHTVECISENFGSTKIEGLASYGSNLYMIRRSDGDITNSVFVTDTKKYNLEWRKVLEFPYSNDLESCQIIGETMYILCKYLMELIVIDLTQTKPVKVIELLGQVEVNPHLFDTGVHSATLMKNNDKLYIIVQDDTRRTVHVLESNQQLRIVNETRGIYTGYCIFTANGNKIFPKKAELESYDFENNCWTRTTVEPAANENLISFETAFELDSKVYVIVHLSWHDGHQYDVRVLDLKPNLSNICWINFVDEMMSMENMDRVQEMINQFPDFLRYQLDSAINWRITEAEKMENYELFGKRLVQMLFEIRRMRDDGEISEEQDGKLIDLFVSEDAPIIFAKDRAPNELNDEELETDG